MYETSYRRKLHKKYERSDVFEDSKELRVPAKEHGEGSGQGMRVGRAMDQGWESLQELNERFARYISRARALEQRNAVFRKQLETLQRMEQVVGLEEAFSEPIGLYQQRLAELASDRARLDRERRDAAHMLEDFTGKYRNECEHQEQLRSVLEKLNKEADSALLRNLEYQIQSQFLQDDINSTRDRHKKNLAEIQTYVKILNQINQMPYHVPSISLTLSEECEKLYSQRWIPTLQSQLDEYKSALCQLEAQKEQLQDETSALELTVTATQESYEEEIRLYEERIELLRMEIDEAERLLDRYTDGCRRLAVYQSSLESELERYRRIIENEDTRLNSAIIGTPITLLTADYRCTTPPSMTSRGRDITQAVQEITNVKSRQKNLAKKVLTVREIAHKNVRNSRLEEQAAPVAEDNEDQVTKEEQLLLPQTMAPEDVPDGAQISKAIDTLCNIVRERMHQYMRQEPIADFYVKRRYVLVSGESSYMDPCFCSSSSSGGHVFVTICNDRMSPYYDREGTPTPIPAPVPLTPTQPEDGEKDGGKSRWERGDGIKGEGKGNNVREHSGENHRASRSCPRHHKSQTPDSGGFNGGLGTTSTSSTGPSVDSVSYEMVEVLESVEEISSDNKVRGYEATATIVETTIEKTSKKKQEGRTS